MKSGRDQIAREAANFLAQGFVQDYHAAKLKAVKKLGIPKSIELPTNLEVEAELKAHQEINNVSRHEQLIHAMRTQSIYALQIFNDYSARLVGSVFEGTATKYSPIEIQVYSDSPKEVVIKLLDLNIPFDTQDRDIRLNKNEISTVPVYSFGAGEYEFEISALPLKTLRQSPLSPINGQPMARASLKKLRKMLGDN